MVAKNTSRYEPSQSSLAWPSRAMAARSSGVTVTPSRPSNPRTGSAAAGGTVRLTSMSVVARGLRYQTRAMAPPNWWGTPAESSISWSETILGARSELSLLGSCSPRTRARAIRSARSGRAAGIAAAPGARAGPNGSTLATKPRRPMRASPGSAAVGRRRRTRSSDGPSGGRPRRTAASRGARWRAGPSRRPVSGGPFTAAQRRPVPPQCRRDGSPADGPGQHLVVEPGEVGQGAGAGALGGVDRLPDLEPALGTGDHVRHTHYITHYWRTDPPPSDATTRGPAQGHHEAGRAGWPPWKPLLAAPS